MSEKLIKSRGENGVALFLALVSGKITPAPIWNSARYRCKFLLRSLAYPVTSWRHMRDVATLPTMQQALNVQAMLPGKIHRPYLHLALSARQRAQVLSHHYRFVQQLQSDPLRNAMLSPQSCTLANFSGKEGEQFTVTLSCTGRCEREGEVNLILNCDNVHLAIVTFAVIGQHGTNIIFIGGIQGADSTTPHELIRQATKSCYGLFPKRLLLEIITQLAEASGISVIQAVSDHGHTFRSLRYRFKKQDQFLASYDEFWLSLNAQPISPELYQLPFPLSRKPLEAIASKKRAEYRRRYELLDIISQRISNWYRGDSLETGFSIKDDQIPAAPHQSSSHPAHAPA